MDFQLTKQQKLAQKIAREFAQQELEPRAQELDETMEFPRDAIQKMAQLGFMGISIPKEYGGAGLDTVSYTLIIEELAKACASTAIIVAVHNSVCAYPIHLLGTEKQKQNYLISLAQGKKLGAFALTEPNAGSDPTFHPSANTADGASMTIVKTGLSETTHFCTILGYRISAGTSTWYGQLQAYSFGKK